jgi:hypothetical protein
MLPSVLLAFPARAVLTVARAPGMRSSMRCLGRGPRQRGPAVSPGLAVELSPSASPLRGLSHGFACTWRRRARGLRVTAGIRATLSRVRPGSCGRPLRPAYRRGTVAPAMPTTGNLSAGRGIAVPAPALRRDDRPIAPIALTPSRFIAGALRLVARYPASTLVRLADRRPLGAGYVARAVSACGCGLRGSSAGRIRHGGG